MPTYPSPELLSTAAADALGGTTLSYLRAPVIALGASQADSPTYYQQYNRIVALLAKLIYGANRLMAVREGGLNIGVYPGYYRKSDGTDVAFDGATAFALTDSATNYVYILHSSGALTKSTVSFPADTTTFTPIAVYVCAGGAVSTSDEEADRRHLALYQAHSTTAAVTGTSSTTFLMDNDNAGAEATQQIKFERGSTDAEDAAIEWDATNDRFNLRKQHSTNTLAPVNASEVMVAGTAAIESDGDLAAASIATDQLYTFGANADPPVGVKLTASGSSGAPSAGAHTKGELAVDTNGKIYICTADGTPGTWQQIGKQDDTVVWSVGNGSGASAGAAQSLTIQAQDQFGNSLAAELLLKVHLMNDVDGAADAANITAVSASAGSLVRTVTANKVYVCKTNASGTLTLSLTNSIAGTVYVLTEEAPGSRPGDHRDTGSAVWT